MKAILLVLITTFQTIAMAQEVTSFEDAQKKGIAIEKLDFGVPKCTPL